MTTTDNRWGTRIAARSAAAVVALVAGAASFEHIASVAKAAGERTWVAYSLPFAIDGLIVVGVAALIEDQRQNRRGRMSARLAVLVGVVATLAANVASANPTWTARLVALAAPVSFLISVEVLTRTGRKLPTPDDTTATPDDIQPHASQPAAPAGSLDAAPGASSAEAPAGRSSVKPAPAKRKPTKPRPNAAERVAKAVRQTPTATPAQIAARLKVSERTVQRYWPTTEPAPAPAPATGPASAPAPAARSNGRAPVTAAAFTRTDGNER